MFGLYGVPIPDRMAWPAFVAAVFIVAVSVGVLIHGMPTQSIAPKPPVFCEQLAGGDRFVLNPASADNAGSGGLLSERVVEFTDDLTGFRRFVSQASLVGYRCREARPSDYPK